MFIRNIGQTTAAMILMAGSSAMSLAHAQDSTVAFGGVDARESTYYGYLGVRHHLSGHLTDDGFLLRAFGLYGQYDYDSTISPSGEIDADVAAFDAMIGYQKKALNNDVYLRAFVGPEYEDHDLSPNNPFDKNRGGDFGVKFQGEIETSYLSPYYGSLITSYGTAKDRYWMRLRGGYNYNGFIFGPEGVVTGDEEFSEQRIGAFLTIFGKGPVGVSVSTGYSRSDDNRGDESIYGTLELSTTF